MFSVLGKFKVCEPATKTREQELFLNNYLTGRAVDFTDSSLSAFNSSINEFTLDGITFNNVFPVDRYGIQEDFNFPSVDIRRREMTWSTSTHPVSIDSTANGGFNLFGTYIGIKKTSDVSKLSVYFSSISSIVGEIISYDSGTGIFTFQYDELPGVYTEQENTVNLFSIFSEPNWYASCYDSSLSINSRINTPSMGSITTLEKLKEIAFTIDSSDVVAKTVTGTVQTGLTDIEVSSITSISPANQKLRIIPLGKYAIANNALSVPTATSLNSMPSRSSLGISSYIYYGIPFHSGYSFSNTSRDYFVRTPVFDIEFGSGEDLYVIVVVTERNSVERTNPNGFKMGAKL